MSDSDIEHRPDRSPYELNFLDQLPFSPLDDLFDRFQANIEQRRLAAGYSTQTALDRFAHFAGLFDFLAVAVEGFHDLRILRARHDMQPGKILGLDRPTLRDNIWEYLTFAIDSPGC